MRDLWDFSTGTHLFLEKENNNKYLHSINHKPGTILNDLHTLILLILLKPLNDSQLSKWCSVISTSLSSCSCISSLMYWIGLTYITNRIVNKWWCVTSEAWSWKILWLPLCFLVFLILGVASQYILGMLKKLMERPTWGGIETFSQ